MPPGSTALIQSLSGPDNDGAVSKMMLLCNRLQYLAGRWAGPGPDRLKTIVAIRVSIDLREAPEKAVDTSRIPSFGLNRIDDHAKTASVLALHAYKSRVSRSAQGARGLRNVEPEYASSLMYIKCSGSIV